MSAAALLARIDALLSECDKATPGPWSIGGPPWFDADDWSRVVLGRKTLGWAPDGDPHCSPFVCQIDVDEVTEPDRKEIVRANDDARFIAASRAGWPGTLRALRVAVEALRDTEVCGDKFVAPTALAEIARLLEAR